MKKVILSSMMMLALCVSFVSCKEAADKAKEATEAATDAAEDAGDAIGDAAEGTMDKVDEMASGVPSFDNAEVADYVKSYNEYFEEYKAAAESKDMTAFSNLATKGQELATKSQDVMKNLSADDAAKLTEYMTEKSKEMQELATKMMQ